MGTIGGNLVNASPAADSLPPLLIHDAVITLESAVPFGSSRTVRLDDFIVSPYKTTIRDNELLTQISLRSFAGYREGYRRVAKRSTWAISRLSIAWAVLEDKGRFRDVKLAIGSCTPMPFRARAAEEFLSNKDKSETVITEAINIVLEGIRSMSGERPSYAYKFPVLRGMLENILRG
jgi:carbon-monoxide dehydrogenase medium subunit